mmetsp:Transcript_26328/g.41639  ORF Transcript_26328/g.41639 Transcript_26328/m.41639 type:complete len:203 (+) Transcript_26328:848-1456(+)
MLFDVLFQMRRAAKRLPACNTVMVLLRCMDLYVFCEIALLTEPLPALSASIRFLSSVYSEMFVEVTSIIASLPTVGAFEWFFACVNTLVVPEMCPLSKLFPTCGTRKGLLSCVYPEMRVQLIPALKRLLTLSTREFLLRPLRGFLVSRALPRQDGERAGLKGTHRRGLGKGRLHPASGNGSAITASPLSQTPKAGPQQQFCL